MSSVAHPVFQKLLKKVIAAELVAIAVMLYVVNYAGLKDSGREPLGLICVVLNIASIGAPLFQVGEVSSRYRRPECRITSESSRCVISTEVTDVVFAARSNAWLSTGCFRLLVWS